MSRSSRKSFTKEISFCLYASGFEQSASPDAKGLLSNTSLLHSQSEPGKELLHNIRLYSLLAQELMDEPPRAFTTSRQDVSFVGPSL
mgnify:CR=1 FL=1